MYTDIFSLKDSNAEAKYFKWEIYLSTATVYVYEGARETSPVDCRLGRAMHSTNHLYAS